MSTTGAGGSTRPSPNDVTVETGDGGIETGYKCAFHRYTNIINDETAIVKDTYYDMRYPCSRDPAEGMQQYGSAVLQNIAKDFRILPDGEACTIPDTTLPLWMIGVSAQPGDSIVQTLDCQTLVADVDNGICCVVVKAPMTFWWTDVKWSESDILDILRQHFTSPVANVALLSDDYEIEYLGAFIDTTPADGNDLEPTTVNPPEGAAAGTGTADSGGSGNVINDPQQQGMSPVVTGITDGEGIQQTEEPNNFTIIGGFVLAGLLVAFLGAVFVLMRRRNRNRQMELQMAVQKSGTNGSSSGVMGGYGVGGSGDYGDQGSDGPTLEVDVLSDDVYHVSSQRGNSFDLNDMGQDDFPTPSSYTFDLANCLKNDVMGTYGNNNYGPTSMAVVPPYPMEETSDSEVDSWAQTDGTVGSLEDRLEEITAEI